MEAERNLLVVKQVVGNEVCVDCGAAHPTWASINLGILMCLECSGIHRSLGTHISQVRSLELDVQCWKGSLLDFMLSVGNAAFNEVWEANIPAETLRPQADPGQEPRATPTGIRECFIRDKYQFRIFFRDALAEAACLPAGNAEAEAGAIFGPLEATMEKMPGSRTFRDWQKRTLRLDPTTCSLRYYRTPEAAEAKGDIPLEGASVDLETREKLDATGRHFLWRIDLGEASRHRRAQGYVFHAASARERIRWVENVRRFITGRAYVASHTDPGPLTRAPMPQMPSPLARVQDIFRREAVAHLRDGNMLRGLLRFRPRPSWGVWASHYVCATTTCLLVFAATEEAHVLGDGEMFSEAIVAVPVRHLNIDETPGDAEAAGMKIRGEMEEENPAHVACFYGPLGCITLGFDCAEQKAEWIGAIRSAVQTASDLNFRAVHEAPDDVGMGTLMEALPVPVDAAA